MIAGKAPHANYVFVAPNAGRSLLRLGLLASLVGLCVGGTLAVSERSLGAVLATCVSAASLRGDLGGPAGEDPAADHHPRDR